MRTHSWRPTNASTIASTEGSTIHGVNDNS